MEVDIFSCSLKAWQTVNRAKSKGYCRGGWSFVAANKGPGVVAVILSLISTNGKGRRWVFYSYYIIFALK